MKKVTHFLMIPIIALMILLTGSCTKIKDKTTSPSVTTDRSDLDNSIQLSFEDFLKRDSQILKLTREGKNKKANILAQEKGFTEQAKIEASYRRLKSELAQNPEKQKALDDKMKELYLDHPEDAQ
ncbi:MAG TPA: hypothetical protein ENI73_03910 [Spirochaetes bacterium]|nr:hypothetical protein [Spirochaetota bacterium]